MDEAKRTVIRRMRPELEVKLVFRHLESLLHIEAGGFLTDREIQEVKADEVDYKQVRKLLGILLEKSNDAFIRFCSILDSRDIYKGDLALRLMEGAGMSEFDSYNNIRIYCLCHLQFLLQSYPQYFQVMDITVKYLKKNPLTQCLLLHLTIFLPV